MDFLRKLFGGQQPSTGWIVWESFLTNESSLARQKLYQFAHSPAVNKDRIASGFAGWAVYKHKEIALQVAALLRKAGANDPEVRKVRVFTDSNDPRINQSKMRMMETGTVIEYLE